MVFRAPNDPDYDLVPRLTEKVVTPHVLHVIKWLWDPLSSRQTQALVGLIQVRMVLHSACRNPTATTCVLPHRTLIMLIVRTGADRPRRRT